MIFKAPANKNGKPLGKFRHFLFDIQRVSADDRFGNTFFSEIDVIAASQKDLQRVKPPEKIVKSYQSKDGKYRYIIDSTKVPDLTEWSEKELLPVIEEWYPKIVAMLPSDGYRAAEIANLIAMRKPAENGEAWLALAVEAQKVGVELGDAAKKQDWPAAQAAYKAIIKNCNACHQKFEPDHAPMVEE